MTRDPYAEVGAAHRATYERAVQADLSRLEWRVLGAVLTLTASWSRCSDLSTVRQVASMVYAREASEVTGYQRKRVRETLVSLAEKCVISYESSQPGGGRGARCRLTISETAPEARVRFPPVTGHETGVRSDAEQTPKLRARKTETDPDPATKQTPTGGHTEKLSEDEYITEMAGGDDLAAQMLRTFSRHQHHEALKVLAEARASGVTNADLSNAITAAREGGSFNPRYVGKAARTFRDSRERQERQRVGRFENQEVA